MTVGRVDLQWAAGTEYLLSLWAADEFIQPGTVPSKGQTTGTGLGRSVSMRGGDADFVVSGARR